MINIRKMDGLTFDSKIKFKGNFKIRNPVLNQNLKSIVEFPEDSGIGLANLNPLGWFSKKEEKEEVKKDNNPVKINIIQRKETFPKILMATGR